jgi:hypothetical protein
MFGGGLLWAVAVAVGFTGASPGQLVWAASVLVAVSLPGVVVGQLRGRAEGDRTVVMSTIASVAGVVSILLFPFGGLLTLADLFDWPIYDNFIEAGRRLGQFLLGAGLLGLIVRWRAVRGVWLLRVSLVFSGVIGLASAVFFDVYPLLVTLHVVLSMTWLVMGVAAWPAGWSTAE